MQTQLVRHGKPKIGMTDRQIRNFQPVIPQRIATLLNLARGNASVMPYVTVDGKPCDPLLEQYHQYKKDCAEAISLETEDGTCPQLKMADASVNLGVSETLLEGWIRADLQLRAKEQLNAGKEQAFRLIDRVDAAIAYGQAEELVNDTAEVAV